MMKRLKNIGIVCVLLLYATSCGQDFLDVNVDPNNPATANIERVFPAAVASTASAIGGDYAILGGLWSQYYTQNNGSNQYKTLDAFDIEAATLNAKFTELYAGALNDYKYVKDKARTDKNWTFYLMATVMEAYTYQILVDLYDQIPFREALQGNGNLLTPAYNGGTEVYDSLIVRIDEALGQDFTNRENGVLTSIDPANSDFLFNGDMAKWRQFANTLKLKMYLRQAYARPQVAEAGIRALYNAGAQFLAEDAAMTQFENVASRSNPLFEQDQRQLGTTQNLKASYTLFSFLEANEDPRLEELYLPGTGGVQRALVQGNFNASSTVIVPTSISRAYITPIEPVYFISESESYFLQAEAVARGWGSGDDKALYDMGVSADFERYNPTYDHDDDPTTEEITRPAENFYNPADFIGDGGVYAYPAAGTFDQKLEVIITQKWVSMAGTKQGLEAFFERNRTGIPKESPVEATDDTYVPGQVTFPVEGVTGGLYPKRLLFPDTERSRNPNTPAQEPITKPVWWDVN